MADRRVGTNLEWTRLTPGQQRALDALCNVPQGVPCYPSNRSKPGFVHVQCVRSLIKKGYARSETRYSMVKGRRKAIYYPTELGRSVWLYQ